MPVVLVTGGTRGIGLSLCKTFAEKGWKVAACYHEDEKAAGEAKARLAPLTRDFSISRCDVTQEKEVQDWVRQSQERFGSIDCAIHNAGSTLNARVLNVLETDWDAVLAVHLKGAFWLSKACLKSMLKQGSGHLMFISSVVATTGNIGQASYVSAKAGTLGLARSLAREYGSKNIRVNTVLPGFHKTRLSAELTPEAEKAIQKKHLLPSTASLKEVSDFVVWLAGTQTISGQVFNLDSRIPGWL